MQCWLCCVSVQGSDHDWHVKVWDSDVPRDPLVNQRICQRCAYEVAELLCEKRRAAV